MAGVAPSAGNQVRIPIAARGRADGTGGPVKLAGVRRNEGYFQRRKDEAFEPDRVFRDRLVAARPIGSGAELGAGSGGKLEAARERRVERKALVFVKPPIGARVMPRADDKQNDENSEQSGDAVHEKIESPR